MIWNLLLPFLFSVLPSLFFYVLIHKTKLLKAIGLRIAFSWLLGQYVAVILTFFIALVLNLFSFSGILLKSSSLTLIVFGIALSILRKELIPSSEILKKKWKKQPIPVVQLLVILICALFSYLFYSNQLLLTHGFLYTGSAYWDFKWHMPLIQSFAYGDNIPPESEGFSGVPATYHFFWDFMVAIYSVLGLGLVGAVNFVSIASLFFLLLGIIGFCQELFGSLEIGYIAVLLTITSSSAHFVSYIKHFLILAQGDILTAINLLLTNSQNPYFFSLIMQEPFRYNGTMFNMFYLLAERHMVIGIIFLLFSAWIVYKRDYFSKTKLFITGAGMGFFMLWHLSISISVFFLLLFILIFSTRKEKSFALFLGFSIIFFLQIGYFKLLTGSMWFLPNIGTFPKLNYTFSTMHDGYSFSVIGGIVAYIYSYGLKIILLPLGLYMLKKKNLRLCLVMIAIILPTFILLNSVQLSPKGISDNHKWIRSMNIFVDMVVAFSCYHLFFKNRLLLIKGIGVLMLILLTLSGVLELIPFLNAKPTSFFSSYPSEMSLAIRNNTKPKSTFVGRDIKEIQLAGRKLFLGSYDQDDLIYFNKEARIEIIKSIYSVKTSRQFCLITRRFGIDYVEYPFFLLTRPSLFNNVPNFSYFTARNQDGQRVMLIDTRRNCASFEAH